MNLRPRSKTEGIISKRPRISIFPPAQPTPEKQLQKTHISPHHTHTTTRANIFDLKQPQDRPKSTSNRKKKYIHVVSGEVGRQDDQKNMNIDILGSLKKYLQKSGSINNKNTGQIHSFNPTDTPIKKLSIFQELEIDNDNRVSTMREPTHSREKKCENRANPNPKFFTTMDPPPTQATTRQKIHLFSNGKIKTQPRVSGNQNSIGKLRNLIKIVGKNI